MYLRCTVCGYAIGDEPTPKSDLLKQVEEEGGSVDTSKGDPVVTCPKCDCEDVIEFIE